MDWAQARNFLILVFLAVDLFLGYEVWQTGSMAASGQPPTAAGEVRAELAELGIEVRSALPAAPALPDLRLGPSAGARTVRLLLGRSGVQRKSQGATTHFSRGTREVSLGPGGILRYEDRAVDTGGRRLSTAAAWREAEAFLRQRGLFPAGARRQRLLSLAGTAGYEVVFGTDYRGYPIYGAQVTAEVFPAGVRTLRIWWPRVDGAAASRPVLPAARALLDLAAVLPGQQAPTVITQVRLGFYAGMDGGSTAQPSWRVRTADGSVYYLDARTGRLEP